MVSPHKGVSLGVPFKVVVLDQEGKQIAKTQKFALIRLLIKGGQAEPVRGVARDEFVVKLKTDQKYDW